MSSIRHELGVHRFRVHRSGLLFFRYAFLIQRHLKSTLEFGARPFRTYELALQTSEPLNSEPVNGYHFYLLFQINLAKMMYPYDDA